ncbi:hypothetical protein Godav_021131, partial [Gossypium davidsonii]|nr:hypothetical protein [Gossypium davidsonii]
MMEPKLLLPQSSGKMLRACQMELIMRKKETSDNLPKKGLFIIPISQFFSGLGQFALFVVIYHCQTGWTTGSQFNRLVQSASDNTGGVFITAIFFTWFADAQQKDDMDEIHVAGSRDYQGGFMAQSSHLFQQCNFFLSSSHDILYVLFFV